MNCQQFEKLIVDLASDYLMEAAIATSALAHTKDCARCAARLAAERRLSEALRTFAVSEAAVRAPERVRLALRAAFDKRLAETAAVISLPPARHQLRWWMAAAAAILLLVTFTAALWMRMNQMGKEPVAGTGQPEQVQPSVLPKAGVKPIVEGEPNKLAIVLSSDAVVKAQSHSRRVGRDRWIEVAGESAGEESGAEFIPLTLVAHTEPAETEQVVRVEVSRSTLLLWRLPVNAEHGEERVKAEVVIGEDGVVRAVRILN